MVNICLNASIPEDLMMIAYEITKEMEELDYHNNTRLAIDDHVYNCELISNRKYQSINKMNAFDEKLYNDAYYFKVLIQIDPKPSSIKDGQYIVYIGEQLDEMEKLLYCKHDFIRYEEKDIRDMMEKFDEYKENKIKNINKGDNKDEK